ncbi:MAG TPA: efflux RND transporter periplasmic adaptor subunit [Bacteroidales bacterium]|jgi:membrane fusion protein (multidrug efflux system)|nr:efflux RND transporter periplasmic adaptor subunit [Bacteroidales bacterium]
MRKSFLPILKDSLIIAGGSVILFSACSKSENNGNSLNPVPVNVITVMKQPIAYYDVFPGTVVPLNEVELRSEVAGLITGIFFKEGEYIRKGKKLYEIDRSRYLASYQQAKANVDIAAANVERAKRYVERYSKLIEQEAIARQRYDDAQTDLQNADLQLVSARAGLEKALTELNFSIITAPFNGIIGISQVKLGALVTPGQTLLNTISTDNPMCVDIIVNEKELERFRRMSDTRMAPSDSSFRILLPDNSLYDKNGKIHVIDRAIDPQTGTIKIRLEFPNEERRLIAGMSCKVNVLHRGTDAELVIPSISLMEQMSEYFVFVVDSQKVKQTKVSIGALLSGKAVIREGLAEGQQIVTEGIQKLQNGSPVVIEKQEEITD